jgi:5-methylcytosine-specific restriction endonuclease McrA
VGVRDVAGLNRRAPLKRGTSQLKRTPLARSGASLQRTGKLQPRSTKRKAAMTERAKLRDVVAAEQGPRCAWPRCAKPWEDLHEVHTRARSGGDITNRAIIIGLCREHNGRAGDDPRAAECLGVVVPSWAAENDVEHAMGVAERLRLVLEQGDPQPCPWRRLDGGCSSPLEIQRDRCELLHGP